MITQTVISVGMIAVWMLLYLIVIGVHSKSAALAGSHKLHRLIKEPEHPADRMRPDTRKR